MVGKTVTGVSFYILCHLASSRRLHARDMNLCGSWNNDRQTDLHEHRYLPAGRGCEWPHPSVRCLACDATASQDWLPLPIGPILMTFKAKAFGRINRLLSVKGIFLAESDRGSGVPMTYVIVAVLGGTDWAWDLAGDAKTCQKLRTLAIAPALMSAIAKASGTTNRPSSVRGASAELPDQAQYCLPAAELEAGSSVCEQTPLPSELGLKRRRQSDETPGPSTKFRAAGTL